MNSACFDCPVGRYEADGIGVVFNKDAKTVVLVDLQFANGPANGAIRRFAFTEDVKGERGILNDCEQFTYQFATTESDNFRSQLKDECEEGYTSGIKKDYVTDTGICNDNTFIWAEGYENWAEKNLFRELQCKAGLVVACTASGCYCSKLRRDCPSVSWQESEGVTYDKEPYYSKTSGTCEWPIDVYKDCQEATFHTLVHPGTIDPLQIENDVRNMGSFIDNQIRIGCTVRQSNSYWQNQRSYVAIFGDQFGVTEGCEPGNRRNRCFCNSRSPQQKMLLRANHYGVELHKSRTIYDNLCHACPEGQIQNTPGETACVKT
jgi:hypothetical protein